MIDSETFYVVWSILPVMVKRAIARSQTGALLHVILGKNWPFFRLVKTMVQSGDYTGGSFKSDH